MINTKLEPKQAAIQFAKKVLKQSYKNYEFEALHEYTDKNGNVMYWRIRLKNHRTNEKWIRPMYFDGENYKLSEPKFAGLKPLYNLVQIDQAQEAPIFICEGEFCVDALVKLDIPATTSGATSSADKVDWSVLAGRSIIVWPDNDTSGQSYAKSVINFLKLLNCTISIIDVAKLDLPEKSDVIDWLKLNPNAAKANIFQLPQIKVSNQETVKGDDNGKEKQNQSSQLVSFVKNRVVLFHDVNKDVYAQDKETNETRRLDSRQFRDWLVAKFYEETKKSPRDQAMREALATLSGLARFTGECHEVFIRVGQHDSNYYLDLGESGKSRVVEINASGWRIISNPPIRFLRPENLRALPEPQQSGDINLLWRLVNIPESVRLLVMAWLAECLRIDTPFPILELIGEQGSAKSTTQRMLRQLIDPNTCELRAAPKAVEDIFVSAGVNWLASYENISHLSPSMQDALCILSTGGGFAKRKLYSDADETIIDVKRPIVLNGISVSITAQDLIDRTVSVEMPIINARMETTKLWCDYTEQHSSILGGLLTIFSSALAKISDISLPVATHPRLIEFVYLGMAIARVTGLSEDEFLSQFNNARQESIARTLDASPVATALIDWFEKQFTLKKQMPVKELFSDIEKHRPHNTDAWPRSAKGFADALRRAAPALRQIGIECRSIGKIGSHVNWLVERRE